MEHRRERFFNSSNIHMPAATPTLQQLQRALALAEQIQKLEDELRALMGGEATPRADGGGEQPTSEKGTKGKGKRGGRRTFSAETKAKMAASQKARWAAKQPAATGAASSGEAQGAGEEKGAKKRKKHKLSPEGRAKIVAALKARHAAKRSGK